MKMKKLFSIILSTVILTTCCSGLWSVSGSATATDEWYACVDGKGNYATLSDNGDVTVNVSGAGTVLTTSTYDISKYDLKFNITSFTNDYIGFTIAAIDDPAKLKSGFGNAAASDRLDFQVYFDSKTLRIKQAAGQGVSSQPEYNVTITDGEHTFGMRRIGESWYPAIDGIPYSLKDSTQDLGRANDRLNVWDTTKIRFGFVVASDSNNPNAADISVVPSSRFVDTADGIGETTVVSQEDGECTLSGVNNNFITTNAYDISSTDLSFYAGDLGNVGFVRLAVVAPFGKSSVIADGDYYNEYYNPTRLEFWYYIPDNQLVLKFKAGSGAKQVEFKFDNNGTNLRNQTCTFGFRFENDGKWYPAINGNVYKNYDTNKKWSGGNIGYDGIDGLEYIQRFIEKYAAVYGYNFRFGLSSASVKDFSVKNADVINYEDTINAEKLTLVKKYLLGADKLANKWFFDLNRDGNLDLVDLVKVKKASAEAETVVA